MNPAPPVTRTRTRMTVSRGDRRRPPRAGRAWRPPVGARRASPPATGRSSSTTARPTARASSPPTLGATVVREPRPGFGAACFAGLTAADRDVVCFMDCDASMDPGELPAVAGPVLSGEADLVLGARRAVPRRRPLHARLGNRAVVRGLGVRDLGPMRAARRDGAAGARHRGPALRLAAGDGRPRPPRRLADRRDRGRLPAARGPLEGDRHACAGPLRAVRDMRAVLAAMSATVIVIAKAPVPGRSKTRLTPPCTPGRPPRSPRRRWPTRSPRSPPAAPTRRVLALDGAPGDWLPDGFEVVPQRGDGLGERLAAAFADTAERRLPGRHGHAPAHARAARRRPRRALRPRPRRRRRLVGPRPPVRIRGQSPESRLRRASR